MFSFEHRIVESMLTTEDPDQREEVVQFVSHALASMPEFLRLGITVITVALTSWSALRRLVGIERTPAEDLAMVEASPIGLVRQWSRALRSLVLFSENEKMEAAA